MKLHMSYMSGLSEEVKRKTAVICQIIIDPNQIVQKPVHGTTIEPHDGQPWSMMNEKDFLKTPGVDHPMALVDDLGAYEVAHGNLFHTNGRVAILNKELANDSLYMRSSPLNGICRSESSQALRP